MSAIAGDAATGPSSWKVLAQFLALALAWGATNASTLTYLTPLLGVTLGAAILAEPVRWNEPVGAIIIIVGIALGQGRLAPFARRLRNPRGKQTGNQTVKKG